MRVLPAVVAAAWCVSAHAQISVIEPDTRAHLVNGVTTITLPIKNISTNPLAARIELQWLDPRDKEDARANRKLVLPPGESAVEILLPLNEKTNALEERLVYTIAPDYANVTAFERLRGALSFPNIASYAFTLRVLSMNAARLGEPYELHVLTTHPNTGQPVGGVGIGWGTIKGRTDENGLAVLRITLEEEGALSDNTIDAKLGDFEHSSEVNEVPMMPGNLTIQVDKPFYQPGQTMHVRILRFGKNGKAKVGVEHELKIETEEGDVEHGAKLTTSAFGIAATDWQIPANARSGKYQISVESTDDDAPATRDVTIRKYELPSFRVTAHGARSYYLPHQMATLEVSAQYLFGKPLKSGTVRVIEGNDQDGNAFASGSLSQNGVFRASFSVDDAMAKTERFHDRHFIAFVTDNTTNRTEQKKFDLRISKESLHVYLAKQEFRPEGRRIYVTTYSPDGAPLPADVEVLADRRLIAHGRTNRFGIVRLDLGKVSGQIVLRAAAQDGGHVERIDHLMEFDHDGLWLTTERAIYRAGEPIHCQIEATRENATVHVLGWNKQGRAVFSKVLILSKGVASFEIPYVKDFGRELALAAITGSMKGMATATAIFPGPDDLKLRASAAQNTFEPGATAHLQFEATTQVALGIAVVDQSVMERAATDEVFGRPRWFDSNISELKFGDIGYSDLLDMDPSKIDADVELLAEVLAPQQWISQSYEDSTESAQNAYRNASWKALAPLQKRLDDLYLQTLAYPRDTASYLQVGDPSLRDPWLEPYTIRFSVHGMNDVMRICSNGPDKLPNTEDDFCLWEIRRKWFARFESLIGEALRKLDDYPSTLDGISRVIDNAGIRVAALRDPWHSQLRMEMAYERDRRVLKVLSAGPDKTFGTADDVLVCAFSGTYFSRLGKAIQRKIDETHRFPKTNAEFLTLARQAGVDLDRLRDPWGHKYFVVHHTEETYYDKVSFYTYAEYGRLEERRKQLTPSRHKLLITELRSTGKDGRRGTYDDFPVYSFFQIGDEPTGADPTGTPKQPRRPLPPGTAIILGEVVDQSGAAVANAKVTLNQEYVSQTDQEGKYYFGEIPGGIYRLHFESPGFQRGEVANIPAAAGEATRCDFVLQVGAVSETVEVSAPVIPVYTESAEVSNPQQRIVSPTSTPRVREFFPETLFWQPELVTDANGRATLDVKLADTVTMWHVAVIASTADGRVSETETNVKAFQPFQLDLDLPPELTVGDRITLPVPIRNYLNQRQTVTVKASTEAGLLVERGPAHSVIVEKDSSTNAMVDLRAEEAAEKAKLQVSAVGAAASDAIAKSSVIHPDGERKEKSVTNILNGTQGLRIDVPEMAISGSLRAEVKVYPTILARLFEAVQALLERPSGCGEQTISSSYPNLLILKAMKQEGAEDKQIEDRARKNLHIGYERLIGYQSDAGGFEYWHKEQPDAALTAYALRFLKDVKTFVDVDESRIKKAAQWLEKQPASDRMMRAYSIQALVELGADKQILERLTEMAKNSQPDDPYAMAAFASAAIDARRPELAESTIRRLSEMAQDEQGAAYWAMRANTPFHGWGRSGQVETTGMVLSAFAKWRALPLSSRTIAVDPLINRGVLFLLRNTDRYGVWGSGQATMRALTALLAVAGKPDTGEKPVSVLVNGSIVKTILIRAERTLSGPVTLDISGAIRPGTNEVSLRSADSRPVETQFNAVWYEKWSHPHSAQDFTLETKFTNTKVKVNEPVTCTVKVSRPNFRGYGMMIAEVGLPPGAEVDRGSLEASLKQVDSYEVAPDHVTFYVWPKASGVEFWFQFRPRFAMKAKMAQSVLYDYYNPGERSVLVPAEFIVN
jgi:hypothetical protein